MLSSNISVNISLFKYEQAPYYEDLYLLPNRHNIIWSYG